MDNYLVKVTKNAEGVASATVEKRTIGQAVSDSLATMVKDDEASVGFVKTGVTLGIAYGAALYAKYRQTGRFEWSPL